MNKKVFILFIIATTITILLAACAAKDPNEGNPQNEAGEEYIEVYGTIEAKRIINYSIDFTATVTDVLVSDNQRIELGQTLISMDLSEYRNLISSGESRKRNNRNSISQNIQSTSHERDSVAEELRGEIAALQNTYATEKDRLDKMSKLYDYGMIAQEEYTNLQTEVENLRVRLATTESTLDAQLKLYASQTKSLQSELSAVNQNTDVEIMKERLSKSFVSGDAIIADVEAGIIMDINCKKGDIINVPTKLFSIADLDTIYARIEVPEESASDVRIGDKVEIVPVSDSSAVLRGSITDIGSRIVEINGSSYVIVEAALSDTGQMPTLGCNIDVKIFLTPSKK